MAQNLEIFLKTFSTTHGIYGYYQIIHGKFHETPGTPGTKLKGL